MNLATGILTAPRPVPTLDRARASMLAAGFPAPVLAHDTARLGNIQNFLALASVLLCSDAEFFLISEDDVTWRPHSYELLFSRRRGKQNCIHEMSFNRFGVLSLHCTRQVSSALERAQNPRSYDVRGSLQPGVYESHLGVYTWGAQALLFSRESLCALLDSSTFCDYARTHRTGLDGAVFGTLKELELRAWYLLPCLARHDLGEHNSGILHETPHTSRGCDY